MNDHIERTKRMIEEKNRRNRMLGAMNAYSVGCVIEVKICDEIGWREVDKIHRWNDEWEYRVSPLNKYRWKQSNIEYIYHSYPVVPDTINWDHVAPEFKYMARDENGWCWISEKKPIKREFIWGHNESICANGFSSYRKGTVDWKESLVIRPGCE